MKRKNEKYNNIFFDISGVCNGNCPYCHSGRYAVDGGKFITVNNFDKIINLLYKNKVIFKDDILSLYFWGEPLLHPHFSEITRVINKYKCQYGISTNASLVPEIDKDMIKGLDHILFSMSGFSQSSYDRIHGFDLELIKKNIKTIVTKTRKLGYQGRLILSFHVYKFNINEIKAAEKFADSLKIIFSPYFAIINNWWDMENFIRNKLPNQKKQTIINEIIPTNIKEIMRKSPNDYNCPQYDYLIIDENGDVATCCQLPRDHPDYSIGNLFTEEYGRIINRREKQPVCKTCLSSGLSFYYNTSLVAPDFYKPSRYQKYLFYKNKFMNKLLVIARK